MSKLICPKCGKELNNFDWGYGCSGYKEGCKFSISKVIAGRTISEEEVQELLTNKETKLLSGFRSRAGKNFDAHLTFDDDFGIVFKFETVQPKESNVECPVCGNKMLKGRWSYSCDSCGVTIQHTIAGRELTEEEFTKLITEGQTDTLDGFKSKAGKDFSAALVLNDENKIEFKFD